MNADLSRLQAWASDRAQTDDDVAARPLWAQIAREVETYREETEAPTQTGADLFGGAS
jgi:hypothetical protein